jgi:hypothetical protein
MTTVMSMTKTYTELRRLYTFEERFKYLSLHGQVGKATFGFDRYVNQRFYRSREWKQIRNFVIVRDDGCDLGIEGYEIHGSILVHHMNPMEIEDISRGNDAIFDPEFLITTTHRTHNAIHYGDANLLPRRYVERRPGDTQLWERIS